MDKSDIMCVVFVFVLLCLLCNTRIILAPFFNCLFIFKLISYRNIFSLDLCIAPGIYRLSLTSLINSLVCFRRS